MKAQQTMKTWADAHRQEVHFEVGDWVYLKLRPYRQRFLALSRNEKLSTHYYGPFKVVKHIGKVAYWLALPPSTSIHLVFHVSQLRKVIGDHVVAPTLPLTLTIDMEILLEPAELGGVH